MPGLGWSGVGNTYRRNVVRNGPHTAAEGGGNNTFIDCHCGIFIGGGRHHVVEGNHFIRTATPVHVDDRGLTWQKEDCTPPNGQFWKELDGLNFRKPPYASRYPELLHIDRPCVPVHNKIQHNTWCGSSKFADISAAQASSWNITLSGNLEKPDSCKKVTQSGNVPVVFV